MSPADAARRSLEALIAAHRLGDRQAQVDTRRWHKAAIRDLARAAHREQLAPAAREPGLFTDPDMVRAAIAALTALRHGSRSGDVVLLREYAWILNDELLVDPKAAVMALLGIALLLMGESLSPVAYVLGFEQGQS